MSHSFAALLRLAWGVFLAACFASFVGANTVRAQTTAATTSATTQTTPRAATRAMVQAASATPEVYGKIDWGIWVDTDGCMHWWADGGLEGYMIDRVNPKTGKPVCLKKNTCLVANTDTLFATDSAQLTADARRRLVTFFRTSGAFGYGIYGFTDSRGPAAYNLALSERRAAAVAALARSIGASVYRQQGFGATHPVASNATAAGMRRNRRVQVVCYRWSR